MCMYSIEHVHNYAVITLLAVFLILPLWIHRLNKFDSYTCAHRSVPSLTSEAGMPTDNSSNYRPDTATAAYLNAVNTNHLLPWPLLSKCVNPSAPTLQIQRLGIGNQYGKALCRCKSEHIVYEQADCMENIFFFFWRLIGLCVKYERFIHVSP